MTKKLQNKKILILSNSFDSHVNKFISFLREYEYVILNTDELNHINSIQFENDEVIITSNSQQYNLNDFKSIWFRKPYHWWFMLSTEYAKLDESTKILLNYKKTQTIGAIKYLLHKASHMKIPILPNPFLDKTDYSKIRQLQIARQIKLIVPNTLITSDKKKMLEFFNLHKKKIVIKNLVTFNSDRLDLFESLAPTVVVDSKSFHKFLKNDTISFVIILQKLVENKIDIRVTCVGPKTFSCSILPKTKRIKGVDIRMNPKEKLLIRKFSLPTSIKQKLIQLNKKLGLTYSAIDLAYDADNRIYYFLEVNPYGQYLYIEESSKFPITHTLVNQFRKLPE